MLFLFDCFLCSSKLETRQALQPFFVPRVPMNTIQIGEIQIGDKTFRSSELFSAGYPTSEQMTTFCSTLGPLIENGVPMLKALSLTAASSQHPWLRVILAGAACKIREGEMIVDGVVWSLTQMYTPVSYTHLTLPTKRIE